MVAINGRGLHFSAFHLYRTVLFINFSFIGFRQRIYRHLRLKPPFDLKGQVNKLFFSDQPIIFSQDDGNFIIAMAAFANYENEVSSTTMMYNIV